tara:strand:+ start:1654 stop:1947 length:294 start_codon:yes stop_codon:yes gene_type:complete
MTSTDDKIDEHIARRLLDSISDPSCHWTQSGATCCEAATWIMPLSCGHFRYYCSEHQAAMHSYIMTTEKREAIGCRLATEPPEHPIFMHVTVEWRKL